MTMPNFEKHYKAICSKEFANFMVCMRTLISEKMKFVAPIYPPLFWRPSERFYFMEVVHDYIWRQKMWEVKYDIENFFDVEWSWPNLVPQSGPLFRRLDKMLTGVEADGTTTREDPGILVPIDSIVFWRNCRHHYNDKLQHYEKVLTPEEIEEQLDEKIHICANVFHAMCSFIFLDTNSYDSAPTVKFLLGYICEYH